MALSFPNSPSVGDVHEDSASGFSYQWSGELWKSYKVNTDSLGGNLDADLTLNSNDITGTGDVDITGNLKISGVATASAFVGDGSALTGIDATSIKDSNGTVRVQANPHGAVATGIVTATSFVGDITGDVTGNAATATQLETARNIGGVSFDGTADINLPGVNAAGNQNTSGTAAGLSGSPSITVTDITASGDITVGGTLTYEDVSNVDSVGLITARTGIRVTAGGIEVSNGGAAITGVTTSTSFVKSGGTSSQFLKADGSVDSSTYITSADGGNAATLDSLDSSQFLRSDAADTKTSGNLTFNDSIKAVFGTGSDLEIFHDGSNSIIDDTGQGSLVLRSDTSIALRKRSGDENQLLAYPDGGVELYYDNSKKIETTTNGVDVTGVVVANSGSNQVYLQSSDGSIEITRSAGGAYIDFKNSTSEDYDARIQESSGGFSLTGNLSVAGNVNSNSDVSLKDNITTIPNALDKVLEMRGVEYDRNDMDGEHQIGVIAQEIEKVIPEVVNQDEASGLKSVSYGNITAVLIEAVKEQQKQIEDLKQVIKELKGKS